MGIIGCTDGVMDSIMHPCMATLYADFLGLGMPDRNASVWVNSRLSPNGANYIAEHNTGVWGQNVKSGERSQFVLKPLQAFRIDKEQFLMYTELYREVMAARKSAGDMQVTQNGANLQAFLKVAEKYDAFIAWKMFKMSEKLGNVCFGLLCNEVEEDYSTEDSRPFGICFDVFSMLLESGIFVPDCTVES
jgi:hypothetical protein